MHCENFHPEFLRYFSVVPDALLYFATIVDKEENGFIVLEVLHHFVEMLDRYFGNVCELDLIFNFHKAYQILDEIIMCGYVHEPSILQNITYRQKAGTENTFTRRCCVGGVKGGRREETLEHWENNIKHFQPDSMLIFFCMR